MNILGPDETYKFREDVEALTKRVATMIDDIKLGWRPPPLIATDLWENELELADGGHRQRALLETGVKVYPVIFYFRDKVTMHSFLDQL